MKRYAIFNIDVEVDDISMEDMEKLVVNFSSLLKKKAGHMFDKIDISVMEIGECSDL